MLNWLLSDYIGGRRELRECSVELHTAESATGRGKDEEEEEKDDDDDEEKRQWSGSAASRLSSCSRCVTLKLRKRVNPQMMRIPTSRTQGLPFIALFVVGHHSHLSNRRSF